MAGSINKRKQPPTTPSRARPRRRIESDVEEDSDTGGSPAVVISAPANRVSAFSQQKDRVSLRGSQLLSQLREKFSLEEARQVNLTPSHICSGVLLTGDFSSFWIIRLALTLWRTWVLTASCSCAQ